MLVLALLASLGMPIGAQNMDNKGRVSGDSVTVDVGANRTFSRHESTAAVSTVYNEEFDKRASKNISNSLFGQGLGLTALQNAGNFSSTEPTFYVRGLQSLSSSSPLVLVDGLERDMSLVSPEEVESVSILKDAAAVALYGYKGINGAILITTKRGKYHSREIKFTYDHVINFQSRRPDFVNAATYAEAVNEARGYEGLDVRYTPLEIHAFRYGRVKGLSDRINVQLPYFYPNVDWMDMLLKDGAWSNRINLNMSGGGTTARYFVSASYVKEDGMYNTDESLKDDYNTNAAYHRWNYRLNTDIDITKTTLLKVGVAGFLSKRNSPGLGDGDVWGELFGYNPIKTPVMYSNGYIPAIGSGNKTNPWVAATQTGFNENWTNNIETNISLEQNFDFITKGLKFVGRFGYDSNNQNTIRRLKWPEQWLAERARDPETGELRWKKISGSQNMKQESSSSGNRREFLDMMLNWDRSFGAHHPSATIKYTQDSYIQTQNLGEDLKTGINKRNQDLAGRVAYNWNYRYFIDFNFGYNGSENFAKGDRFGFFPAFSLAWNIAEEPFIKKHLKWMNMFKVRFSYGKVGNDNVGTRFPYLYTIADRYKNGDNEIIYGGYDWAQYPTSKSFGGLGFADVASNGITWEVAEKNDLGIDLALFNDKFTATIDYFDEKRTGIYMVRNYLPQIVGLNGHNPAANVGAVSSKGFDGHFSYKQRINDVNLTVRGNITYSKNEVLERDEENNVYAYQMQRGYRVDQCKGLIAEGLFKDYDDIRNSPTQSWGKVQPGDIKYRDVNGDGVINDGDQVAIGATSRPNLIYGLGASASWKGLDVNVHFQGAGKSTFFTYGKCVWAFTEGEWGNIFKGMLDNRWVDADTAETLGIPANENPNASYPRLSYQGDNASNNNYRNSTFW